MIIPNEIELDEMQDFIIKEYEKKTNKILPIMQKYDYRKFKLSKVDFSETLDIFL